MFKALRTLGALVGVGALLLGAGCAPDDNAGTGGTGEFTVVTSFYPLQYVAEHIVGDHASVENLTEPGSEPHDLELAPRQIGAVGDADLVFYLSKFQAAVDEAITASGADETLDAATLVELRAATGDDGHDHGDHDHGDEGHEDHDHDHEDGDHGGDEGDDHTDGHDDDGHDHDHGTNDPHFWLDPTNMVKVAEGFAERMIALDPDHRADYEANRDALVAELTTLDTEFTEGLASCERSEFITSHTAFGYLADRYQLTQIGIAGLSPENEPSPSRIAEIHAEAAEHGITTIFYETLTSDKVAAAIAGDLGLKTDVLDPLEGITADSRGDDYLAVMRANLAALQSANGCQ